MTTTEGSDVRHEVAFDEGADEVGAGVHLTDPDEPDDVEPAPYGLPVVDRGECPLCGSQFDDPSLFRDHLGEAHGLYDEEGATSVLTLPTVTTIESPEPAVPIALLGPSRTRARAAAPEKFPVGLAIFVVLLIVFGGGLVYFVQSNRHSEPAAHETPTQSVDGLGSRSATTSSPSSPSGSDGTAASDGGGVAGAAEKASSTVGTALGGGSMTEPAPTTSSASATTAPSTTVPQTTFVAPTTSGAAVDSCSRDHGQWVVTYSWQFVGGTGWSPLAAYTSLGNGRYQHTVKVAPNGNSQITKVQVTDSNGTRHDVALNPALSTSSC